MNYISTRYWARIYRFIIYIRCAQYEKDVDYTYFIWFHTHSDSSKRNRKFNILIFLFIIVFAKYFVAGLSSIAPSVVYTRFDLYMRIRVKHVSDTI